MSTENLTTEVTLSEPVKDEVRNTYKQYLKLHGKRVLIAVPEFYRETGLNFNLNNKVSSVLLSLDDGTKEILVALETFVQDNVQSEKYKPLWLRDNTYVNVSQWCQYEQINSDGTRSVIQPGSCFGKGYYSVLIHASHVYIGPHKGGETYSLSLHVVQITYKPSEDIMDLIQCLSGDCDGPTPPPASSQEPLLPVKKTAKKKRVPRGKPTDGENKHTKTISVAAFPNGHVL